MTRSALASGLPASLRDAASSGDPPPLPRWAEPEAQLVVGPGARWLRTPRGVIISLETRAVLRRLVLALVEAHAEQRSVNGPSLIAATWPGEILSRSSARNRLAVALSTLRQLGLRDAIVHRSGSWRLRPDWRIELDEADASARLDS